MKETRTPLKIKEVTETFYEAVLECTGESLETQILTRRTMEELESSVNVYVRDGSYKLIKAEKVERIVPKFEGVA